MISETTKRVVLQQRQALKSRYEKNLKDIEDYLGAIARLKAANVTLKTQHDALKKDVAEPKPATDE